MELGLKPTDRNPYLRHGILIRGASPRQWVDDIEAMGLSLSGQPVYPIPDRTANSIWGCLLELPFDATIDTGQHNWCQLAGGLVYLPLLAQLWPQISDEEVKALFGGKKHILHPGFGLVELPDPLNWTELLLEPVLSPAAFRLPEPAPFIPRTVRSFRVQPIAPEEALRQLSETYGEGQPFSDKPLNPFEKAKLFFYRSLFSGAGGRTGANEGASGTEPPRGLGTLGSFFEKLFGKDSSWSEKMLLDLEQLEKRNQKHLDKLIDLLKKDPGEALKYALPLDEGGTGRGGLGSFEMQKRWFDFSLFGNSGNAGTGGAAVMSMDAYRQLQEQYTRAAQKLIDQGEFRKAAFVYLKLLKNPSQAAKVLEQGGLFEEAASVYLKHLNDKAGAASCYERGHMTEEAVRLYLELGQEEKAGDLYRGMGREREAIFHYGRVAENYVASAQYLNAGLIYRKKMHDPGAAREVLLRGWREGRDGFNCLNNYFASIDDVRTLGDEIRNIYASEVGPGNRSTFLRLMQHEYARGNELAPEIRDIAYELIAEQLKVNPGVTAELKSFTPNDEHLIKDAMRYRTRRGAKG